MNNLIQKLVVSSTSFLSLVVLSSAPVQALSPAIFTYSFSQTLANDGILTGGFSGVDDNHDSQIEFDEFIAFTSQFQSTIPDFLNLSWGIADLAPLSYFASPDDYSFTLTTGPYPNGTGWNSTSSGLATYVGYANIQDGPISSVDSQTDVLQFTSLSSPGAAVPEPSTIGGAVVFGIGCLMLKRKFRKSKSRTK